MTYVDELTDSQYLQSIWVALRRMEEALAVLPELARLPAPIVNVPPSVPVDLGEIVTAVESLHQPSARDIAMALADILAPTRPDDSGEALREVAEALRLLEFRMQGIGQRVTVGGPSQVAIQPGQTVGVSNFPAGQATEATLADVKRAVTDFETRLDYDARTDGNPVYVGKNANGTATNVTTWVIQKLSYDATNRLTRAQVLTGIWDNRATLGW